MDIVYTPIGVMRCDLVDPETAPRFHTDSDVDGVIEIFEPYVAGLSHLGAYDRILVLFHFHRSERHDVVQRRRGVGELRGVFSLRSPHRPNGIGASVLTLKGVDGSRLRVGNVDLLDGTPILDIKPHKGE